MERRLPKAVLTAPEVETVLAVPDVATPLGLRDRAILETFYSTGMRRKELAGLTLASLDRERGTAMIRQGKGKKDRMVPIGERALAWIDSYLEMARPSLMVGEDKDTVFLNVMGSVPYVRICPCPYEAGSEYLARWLEAWPTGIRYDTYCLDGGAWDRPTAWGKFGTLAEAVRCAQEGPVWRRE